MKTRSLVKPTGKDRDTQLRDYTNGLYCRLDLSNKGVMKASRFSSFFARTGWLSLIAWLLLARPALLPSLNAQV